MKFNKQFCISFAEYFATNDLDIYQAFDKFLDKYLKEPEKPEPGIYLQVLEAAAEFCNITLDELCSGRKYGDIPSCKQMTSKVLHELKCSEKSIAENLPMLGPRATVHSQIMAAARYTRSEKGFRLVINQLRERFGIKIPVV